MNEKQIIAERFTALAREEGVTIYSASFRGPYLSVDTNKDDEDKLRLMFAAMKPKSVRVLPLAPDGVHLNGSRHHRIIATL